MSVRRNKQWRGRVWDPLIRLFHWTLVAAFATAWLVRGEAIIHETAGQVVLVALVIRLAWGLVGPASARFGTFVKGPVTTLRYVWSILRNRPDHSLGHNPAGAAMIVALIVMLLTTTVSGLMMRTTALWGNAEIEFVHGTSASLCVVLIGLHLVGVLVASLQHREMLPAAMITGRKTAPHPFPPHLGPAAFTGRRVSAAILFVSTATLAVLTAQWALNASLWRLPRSISANLAEAGCKDYAFKHERLELRPAPRVHYAFADAQGTELEYSVAVADALMARPALDFSALTATCNMPVSVPAAAAPLPVPSEIRPASTQRQPETSGRRRKRKGRDH